MALKILNDKEEIFVAELEKTVQVLKKKMQVYEDIEAVKNLHISYVYALSNMQWDDMVECFADDALLDVGGLKASGKAEISGVFHNILAKNLTLKDGHFVGEPIVSVKGKKATAIWILYLFYSQPAVRWAQGRQEVEYVKIRGKWKIKTMKFINPWPVQA
jgi:hypothetical protein